MLNFVKLLLIISCIFAGFNLYDTKDVYKNAHWVKAYGNVKAHWAGNPNSNVHCHNNVCKREVRLSWEY